VTFYATGEIALWRGDMLICGRAAFMPTVGAWHEVAIMLFDNALTLMIDGMRVGYQWGGVPVWLEPYAQFQHLE